MASRCIVFTVARQLWLIAGVFFILWGLTVVWVTAQQPILGHRGLNWLVFLSLLFEH